MYQDFIDREIEAGGIRVRMVKLGPQAVPAIHHIETLCFPSPWTAAMIRSEFDKPYALITGALSSDDLLGYCCSHLIASEVHVLTLAVHPSEQRKGFGQALMRTVLSHASDNGAAAAWLEVRASNAKAKAFYSSLGFELVDVRKGYYSDNAEDALILSCSLKQ